MDDMLSAAVPRKLRVRTSIMVGTVRMPLRMFLVGLGTGMLAVLILLTGMQLVYVVSLFLVWNGLFALLVEARWGSHWVNHSTWSMLRIWWRHLRRSHEFRLHPVPILIPPDTTKRAVRPIRWTLQQDHSREDVP